MIVYVSPEGAKLPPASGSARPPTCWPAPQTNIGSSTPVSVGGEDIQEDLRNKVVNDDRLLRALAREHGRVKWVDAAVRRGADLSARGAPDERDRRDRARRRS